MNRQVTRFVHAGKFVAEVTVELIPDDNAWGPYLSVQDALKLERAQKALEAGDLATAAQLGRVYELKPVAAE
jgi:hypothetical protein